MIMTIEEWRTGTSVRMREVAAATADAEAEALGLLAADNRLLDVLIAMQPELSGVESGLDGVAGSSAEVSREQGPLARALDLSNRALETQIKNATDLYEAHLASVNPLYAAVKAQRDYEQSLEDLVELEKDGKQGSLEYAEAVLAAEVAFWRLQAANGEAGVASEAWIGVLNEAIATNRITTEEARFLIDALNDTGIAMLELDGTTIRTKHIHEVVYRAGENLEFIGGAWVPKGSIPYMARGGPVSAGQPYIVGEEGPELIVPNQSGTVMTASQTSSMLGGGGSGGVGGWTVNVHMPPGADGEQVVAALRRWERSNGPLPVGVR